MDSYVNNAGIGMSCPALELTEEHVDQMVNINLKSVLYGMQTAVKYYKSTAAKQGQVINVSSMLGRVPFASFRAMYSASKAAINSLTCNVRVDLQNEARAPTAPGVLSSKRQSRVRAPLPSQGLSDIRVALFTPGVVATDFGLNAIGGGPDNRSLPGAQPVEEVAAAIAAMIEDPAASVDVYSRPAYKGMVGAYYTADDVRAVEAKPPFATPAFAAAAAAAAK